MVVGFASAYDTYPSYDTSSSTTYDSSTTYPDCEGYTCDELQTCDDDFCTYWDTCEDPTPCEVDPVACGETPDPCLDDWCGCYPDDAVCTGVGTPCEVDPMCCGDFCCNNPDDESCIDQTTNTYSGLTGNAIAPLFECSSPNFFEKAWNWMTGKTFVSIIGNVIAPITGNAAKACPLPKKKLSKEEAKKAKNGEVKNKENKDKESNAFKEGWYGNSGGALASEAAQQKVWDQLEGK